MNSTATPRRRQKRTATAETYHDTFRPLDSIFPSPENEKLYRPIDPDDPATIDMAEGISKHGIREPIVITLDGWILSGHRRHVAGSSLD